MRAGYYEEQEAVLRAKIDYAHPNPNNRDPAIFRIMYVDHPHVGDKWCIYPLYDFVHCISDSIEDITHSCCTLEFENRRDLYYWFLEQLNIYRPHVYEYGRLNLSYNVLSKRKLIQLIEAKAVSGWDDPRLLTIAGL
jgi:glutaminyl-tRNA synthetase